MAELIFGTGLGIGSTLLVLLGIGRNPFKAKRKLPAKSPVEAITNLALKCSCNHISNMHHAKGHCLAENYTEGGRYSSQCKCQRYNGPMGLQELELWGPKALTLAPEPQATPRTAAAGTIARVSPTPDHTWTAAELAQQLQDAVYRELRNPTTILGRTRTQYDSY
jgi:hypothetical protein